MSIKVMSAVYESDLTDHYEVAVMLALAWHADDDGFCFPGIPEIARRARCKERAVYGVISRLVERGYLVRESGGGRHIRNRYTVVPNPAPQTLFEEQKPCTPNTVPDAETLHQTTKTLHSTTKNPAPGAPEQSVTVNEQSEEKKRASAPASILSEIASPSAARSFIDHRKRLRKPMSETAAKRLAGNLKAIIDGGGDPDDALGMAEERGWQTVKPDWYFENTKGKQHGRSGAEIAKRAAERWERRMAEREGAGAVVPLLSAGRSG